MAKNPNPKLSKAAQNRRKEIDNARRRYKRAAERYEKEAKNLGGRDAEILQQAAEQLRSRSDELKGIDVRSTLTKDVKELVNDSKNYLVSNNRTEWQRGETLGKLRLSGTNTGHRFFALTEPLWSGISSTGAGDDRRLNAIRNALAQNPDVVEKYGARPNANQMIEIVESVTNVDLDTEAPISYDQTFMRGTMSIIRNYG